MKRHAIFVALAGLVVWSLGCAGTLRAQDRAKVDGTLTNEYERLISVGKDYEKQGDQERKDSSKGVSEEIDLYQQAIDAYTQAITKEPDNPEGYKLRGMVFAKRDQDKNAGLIVVSKGGSTSVLGADATFGPEAIDDLNRAVTLKPKDAETYYVRGQIYNLQFRNRWVVYAKLTEDKKASLGEMLRDVKPDIQLANNAVADFKKAIDLAPQMGPAYHELGSLYLICFKFVDSFNNLRKAVQYGVTGDQELVNKLEVIARDPEKAGISKKMMDDYPLN